MKREELLEILGEVDGRFVEEAAPKGKRPRHRPLIVAAAAILLVCSFSLGAFAATTVIGAKNPPPPSETEPPEDPLYTPVTNALYGDRSGDAEIRLTEMVGDADRALVYFTLTVPEDLAAEQGAHGFTFGNFSCEAYTDIDDTAPTDWNIRTALEFCGPSEAPNTYLYRLRFTRSGKGASTGSIVNSYLKLELEDLFGPEGGPRLLEGDWKVRFRLDYGLRYLLAPAVDVSGKTVTCENPPVPQTDGREGDADFVLKGMGILITPMQIEFDLDVFVEEGWSVRQERDENGNFRYVRDYYCYPNAFTLVMKDGSTREIPLNLIYLLWYDDLRAGAVHDTFRCSVGAEPIDPHEVASIEFGGVTVDLSGAMNESENETGTAR